ncbi:MAG: hypothetical protein IT372_05705 [Polyangiaceae bacterium]|nr:hypothetical protein [Polyangiaceae bacterium]
MQTTGRAAEGAAPRAMNEREATEVLRALLREEQRVRARRGLFLGVAVGLLLAATVRVTVAASSPRPSPAVLAVVIEVIVTAVALAAAAAAGLRARRAERDLAGILRDAAALLVIRDALSQRAPSPVPAAERSSAPGTRPEARRAGERRPAPRLSALLDLAAIAAAGLAIAIAIAAGGRDGPSGPRARWTFLEEVEDPAALGFTVPTERAGAWRISPVAGATGARALVNLAGALDEAPATAVAGHPSPRDAEILTRCKTSPDLPEQACGVVFRYRDARNHYVARVDSARGEITLGVVVNGAERAIRSARVDAPPSTWQELRVRARGDRHLVEWNGRKIIEVHDPTLSNAGAVGLWAPANCVAYFDELSVQPLAGAPHPSDLLPIMLDDKKRRAVD